MTSLNPFVLFFATWLLLGVGSGALANDDGARVPSPSPHRLLAPASKQLDRLCSPAAAELKRLGIAIGDQARNAFLQAPAPHLTPLQATSSTRISAAAASVTDKDGHAVTYQIGDVDSGTGCSCCR